MDFDVADVEEVGRVVTGAGGKAKRLFLAFVVAVLALVLLSGSIFTVDQTEVAVVKTFGKYSHLAMPGLHFKIPFVQSVEKYYVGVRTIDLVEGKAGTKYGPVIALSNDGLEIRMDVSVQTSLKPEKMEVVAKTFRSPEFIEAWKISTVRGVIRDVIAGYNAEALYGEQRSRVEGDIRHKLEEKLSKYYNVHAVYIRKVTLPANLKQAIEAKLQAQQDAMRMQFVVEKEKREAERKKIEAEGIAKANEIIGQSMRKNPEYLQWYYMKALEEMAKSPNTMFVLLPVPSSYIPNVNITQASTPQILISPK